MIHVERVGPVSSHLLVAEDSLVIQRLISMCLVAAGIELEFCSDGADAVERAKADPPSVMVLDIGLPSLDGWAVLRAVRADPRTSDTPVLMLSGASKDLVQQKADELGADAVLSKPFNPDDLRQAVMRLISHGRAA